ncbi:MAG: hypothetical protein FJ121_08915 [Deltaproteobacteria bacterium]|nr:hypothetical protein [Deltaproteobacteria bacterium]
MDKKAWYRSKTLWINLVAGVALVAQSRFGFVIDAEVQGGILTVINLVLRLITKEPVGLKDEQAPSPFPGIDAGPQAGRPGLRD